MAKKRLWAWRMAWRGTIDDERAATQMRAAGCRAGTKTCAVWPGALGIRFEAGPDTRL